MTTTPFFYIKTVDGALIGPFTSYGEASTKMITEQLTGKIVNGTEDRKEILLG